MKTPLSARKACGLSGTDEAGIAGIAGIANRDSMSMGSFGA
jgi:hypothetical protein